MRALDFRPSGRLEAGHVSFLKEYADLDGIRHRVHVFFDKPILGLSGMRLASIVISSQQTLAPLAEDLTRAPDVAQPDLTALIERLSSLVPGAQSIEQQRCIQCAQLSSDFYRINADAVCYACVETRQTQNVTTRTSHEE